MVTKCLIRQSLDSNEIREIKEIMEKNSFSTLSSLYKKLSEIFRPEGVTELDTRAAYESGLYDLQGMSEINLDKIDDLLYKIEGTLLSKDIYVTPSSDDVASFMDTSRKTILGTPEFISQEEIEEEIIYKVENPKNTSEVSSLVNNLPYSSFAERFNSDETFRDKVLKNVGMYTKVQTLFIEDGVPTTKNLTYYKNLQRTVKQDNDVKSLLADVEYLEEIDNDIWNESQEEIKEVLKEIEDRQFNENAIDIFGLNKYSSNKELVISTLDSLGRMIENPTNENIFNFSEKFTNLVPQQESSFSEIIPENLEPYSQNIFKVYSNLSESSLFRDHGLVKIGDNLYHKVDLGNRSDLYEELYQKALETGSPINLKSEDKEEALRELSQYVMLQDSTVDKDIREDHTLNKLIFNHPKAQDINDYSQLSDITSDPEYLVGTFPSDFNDYIIVEKQNDSKIYRDVLSKFRVGESGIYLTAPVRSIEGIDFQRELEDYIRLSKDQSMKYLLPARTTELKKDSDLIAINNPISVPTYSRQYTVDNGLLVTESTPENNIRFFGKTYSKVAEDSKNSVFKQVPENPNANFYSINKDFITEEDRQIASRILNDAKFSFVDPVVTKQDFDKSVEKAGIQNQIKFSIGTAYSNEYVALNPDVQIKRGENYQFDLEWDVLYKGSAVGKMYYSREDKTWVDALNYSRKDFEWMVSENKNEAANILAERYKPKEKVDILAVTLGEMTKTASISRNPVGKELIYNNNLLFDLREFDGNLELSSIYSIEPNKGTATAFMRHLSEVADKNNYTITLTAKPFSDRENKMTFNQLVGFYRKHGFKPSRDFVFDTEEDGLVMVREPRYEQEVDSFDGLQNYERWRGQNKEYSRADIQNIKTGEPVVIRGYHGTTNEFYEFDSSVKGNVEGHLGKMNYFTSDYQDASSNYLSDGADIKLRVGQLTDKLELAILDENLNEDEEVDLESVKDTYKISDEDIEEIYPDGIPETINARDVANFIANRDLVGSEELVLDLYIKLNNPVVLGKGSAWIEVIPESEYIDYLDDAAQEVADEYGIDIEEAKEDYYYEIKEKAIYNSGAESVILTALSDALDQNGYDYSIASEIISKTETEFDSQVDLNIIEKAIRDFELYENYYNEAASSQVVADMFKNLGYDGIILTDVKDRFKGMNLNEKTSHIHVFDEYSNQIKLADGSNTHFGSTPDIRYSMIESNKTNNENVLPVIDKLKESKLADNVKLMTSKEMDAQLGRLGVNLKTRSELLQNKKTLSEKGIKPIVNGFVYNNDVYLNRDTITNETPIHEFNHLFTNWMKSNRPSLYNQGINLVKQEVLKSQPGGTTMYRGVGRNFAEGVNSAFTWVASDSETAFNYGEVQEVKVNIPTRPFEFPYKSNVDVRGEDIANLLRNDVYSKLRDKALDKETASKIMREIDSYQKSAGDSLEKYHTKVSKPEASDKIKGILERLGYDGIFINEGKGTYAIFKSEIQNVIDYVKQTQPNLQGESLYEEILTELTGREGAALVESGKKSGIIEWLKNFFKEIGNMLGILDATPAQVANMTVREFAKSSAVQLLKGEDIMSKMNLLRDSISNATTFSSEYTPVNDTVDSVAEELRACN